MLALPQRVSPLSVLSMRRVSAVLTCGGSIAQETPDEIRKFARIRKTLDKISPEALIGGLALIAGLVVYKVVATKMGILDVPVM